MDVDDAGARKIPLFYLWGVIGAVTGYLIRLLLARSLDPGTYGIFYAVIGLLTVMSFFNDFGLGSSFLFHYTKWRGTSRGDSIFTIVAIAKLFLATVLGAVFLLFHEQIATLYFHNVSLSRPILFLTPYFFFEGLNGFLGVYYAAAGRLGLYASINQVRMAIALLLSGLVFVVCPAKDLITGYFIVWFLSFIITGALYILPGHLVRRITRSISWEDFKQIATYGLSVSVSTASAIFLSRIDVLLITYFRSATEVGFYEVGVPVAGLFLVFIDPLTIFLGPMVVTRHHAQERKKLSEAISILYTLGLFLVLPFALFLVIFPREIILLMFGATYLPAAGAMAVLGIAFFFRAFQSINFTFLYGTGHLKAQMLIMWFGLGVDLLLGFLLIPRYGFIAAAWTVLVTFFLMLLFSFIALRRVVDFTPPYVAWAKVVFISVVVTLLAFALKMLLLLPMYVEAIAIVTVVIVVYFLGGIYALKVISVSELKKVLSVVTAGLVGGARTRTVSSVSGRHTQERR